MSKRKSNISNAASSNPIQLLLDLRLEDYKPTMYPMRANDIGAALASTLSEGLYTNPMHAIREYIQNAVDASAKKVIIKLTGNSVTIHDNGTGMSLPELVEARKFGVSLKDIAQNVGFRGIGIYSGFDLCNRLIVTTQKSGEDKRYILTFEFGAMKQQILMEQMDRTVESTSLIDLISTHSTFTQEPGNNTQHWTSILLEDVKPFHLDQLYNTERLREYILRTLPIDFDDKFEYKDLITEQLERLPGYRAAHVLIQADGKPDMLVAKPPIPSLRPPEMSFIKGAKGEAIAFYWACMNKERGKIPDECMRTVENEDNITYDLKDFRGFTYKVKGFTIGDNRRLQTFFSSRGSQGLYWWWTGEIYVLDPSVIPNAERDDFQSSPAKNYLTTEVEKLLSDLEEKAAVAQKEGRAIDELNRIAEEVSAITKSLREKEAEDKLLQWHKLQEAQKVLNRQRGNLPSSRREEADRLKAKAERLQTELRKEMGTESEPTIQQAKKRTSKRKSPTPQDGASAVSQKQPIRTLLQVVEESGWEISDDGRRVIGLIDTALNDVLVAGSSIHMQLLAYIVELLADGNI